MDISTKDLMLIIVLIEKKVPYFLFVFCIKKKLKLVDMLGIFGGRSDMVDNNYIGVPFAIINVLTSWNNTYT